MGILGLREDFCENPKDNLIDHFHIGWFLKLKTQRVECEIMLCQETYVE